MARYGAKAATKVKKAMGEMKKGALKSGRSGKTVKSRKQAIAIGLSEARKAGGKVPKVAKKGASKAKKAVKKGARAVKKSVGKVAKAVKKAVRKAPAKKTPAKKTARKAAKKKR